MRDFGLRPTKDSRLSFAIHSVLVLVATHVTWIAATSDGVDAPERISVWFPGTREDRTAVGGEPASPGTTNRAGSRHVISRSRRQAEDGGIEGNGLDDDDVIDRRRLLSLVPISLQEAQQRQFPSPDGRRWFLFPGTKVLDAVQKRRWEGSQMVVWGKREPERERVAVAGPEEKRGGKHKWATAGNMAVWG